MADKKWKDFEKLTESIFRKLVNDPKFEKVERDVKVNGKDGVRQIDILLTHHTMGLELKTVVECKDHTSKISVGTVDALHSKMQDINANKGIIVSRAGFSTKATAKAKRLGISLCTAHQALSPKWDIDIPIPILIREVYPSHFRPRFTFFNRLTTDWSLSKKRVMINDVDAFEIFKNQWHKRQIKFLLQEEPQKVEINDFKPPYFVRDAYENKVAIQALEIEITLNFSYYLGSLNEFKDSQLLKNITEDNITVLFDIQPMLDYKRVFKKIDKKDIPKFQKLILNIITLPSIAMSNVDYSFH